MKIFGFYRDNIKDVDADTKIQVEKGVDEDKVRFITAGAERMIIDNTGNVGIGTTSPGDKFHIVDTRTDNMSAALFIQQTGVNPNGTAYGAVIEKTGASRTNVGGSFSAEGATNNYGLIVPKGNVGIGTASPGTLLHLNTATDASVTLLTLESDVNNANEYNEILFKIVGGINYGAIRSHLGAIGDSYMTFSTTTDGGTLVQHMTIQHDGKVGIGTIDPQRELHIAQPSGWAEIRIDGSSGGVLELYDGATALASIYSESANKNLIFRTNGATEQIRILSNGNVGIGTVTPTLPLDVKAKSGMSAIGGFCVKLTNKTGSNTIAGQLVQAGTATDDSFILSGVDETENIGVVLDSGIGDGNEAWIVISGIADIAMKDDTAATRGNWVKASSEAGYADSINANPPGGGIPELDEHMREIGNCIENVVAGGGGVHILARCVLHFN